MLLMEESGSAERLQISVGALFKNSFQIHWHQAPPVHSLRCVPFFTFSFSVTGMTQSLFSGTTNLKFVYTTLSSCFLMSQGLQGRLITSYSLSQLCVPLKSMLAAEVEREMLRLNFTIIYKYTGPSDNLGGISHFLP